MGNAKSKAQKRQHQEELCNLRVEIEVLRAKEKHRDEMEQAEKKHREEKEKLKEEYEKKDDREDCKNDTDSQKPENTKYEVEEIWCCGRLTAEEVNKVLQMYPQLSKKDRDLVAKGRSWVSNQTQAYMDNAEVNIFFHNFQVKIWSGEKTNKVNIQYDENGKIEEKEMNGWYKSFTDNSYNVGSAFLSRLNPTPYITKMIGW